jgi:hypothetical protein
MAAQGLGDTVGSFFQKTQLQGIVPVYGNRFNLRDNAGACFYDGYRDITTIIAENAGHA